MKQKVHIVMPAYNAQDTIEKTINAIIKQTYTNWQLFVVNDGSTDNTIHILSAGYWRESRIKVVTKENGGVSSARNTALSLIPDDAIIAYCDSDDIWSPKHLELSVTLLKDHDVVYSNANIVGINGEQLFPSYPLYNDFDGNRLKKDNFIFISSVVHKGKIGLFDSNLDSLEDYDMWIRAFREGKKFIQKPEQTSTYLVKEGGMSWKGINVIKKVKSKHKEFFEAKVKKYSVIIPTCTSKLFKECLNSIEQYTDMDNVELIIVANGYDGPTSDCKSYKLFWFDEKLGYPKAVNYGIKAATSEYVIFLNDDLTLLPQERNTWLNMLEAPFIKNTLTGISGPVKMYHDGFPYILFSCAMSKTSLAKELKLNEVYGIGYGEDLEFCTRAIRKGLHLVEVPSAPRVLPEIKDGVKLVSDFPFQHMGGNTVNTLPDFKSNIEGNFKYFKEKYGIKYSIIIPTYNHLDDCLKPCIESILAYTDLSNVEVIVVANGCTDGTEEYIKSLSLGDKIVYLSYPEALGYSKACNKGIEQAKGEYTIFLNNDAKLLDQSKNTWLRMLEQAFIDDPMMGVTGPLKKYSPEIDKDFIIFFLAMTPTYLAKKLMLNEEYGVGAGEDIEFCMEVMKLGYKIKMVPSGPIGKAKDSQLTHVLFPIYHFGEATVHDNPDWDTIFKGNMVRLVKKYRPEILKIYLNNNFERLVIDSSESLDSQYFCKERARYNFAKDNIKGKKLLEIGCTSGYGLRFFPEDIEYTGVDYDAEVINFAKENFSAPSRTFVHCDIHDFNFTEYYDTIVAFEVIEHLKDGEEIAQMLKQHCDTLLITTPYREEAGKWGPHHLIHDLTEKEFPDFDYKFIDDSGVITDTPSADRVGLMIMKWEKGKKYKSISYSMENAAKVLEKTVKEGSEDVFKDIITGNEYRVTPKEVYNRVVFDIGANHGMFSALCAEFGAKTVIAAEPVTSTYEILKKSASNYDSIVLYNNAVSDVDGNIVKLYKDPTNDGANSLYYHKEDFEYDEVKTIAFKTLVERHNPEHGILKLDCEGAEYDILLNTPDEYLKLFDMVCIEVHSDVHPIYKGYDSIDKRLKELNFTSIDFRQICWFYDDGTVEDVPRKVEILVKDSYSYLIKKKQEQVVSSPSSNKKVMAFVPTKNRYDSLAICLHAIALQTRRPDTLVIYDDGEHKDLREDPMYKMLFALLDYKKIQWKVIFGDGKGQHHGHQWANMQDFDFIWRIDDDEIPEPNVLEGLLSSMKDGVGAVAGSVFIPGDPRQGGSGKITEIFHAPHIQWYPDTGKYEVEHLYSTFLYRPRIVNYDTTLSPAAHREETIFTNSLYKAGYKLIVDTSLKTYHYKSPTGGIREKENYQKFFFDNDDRIFLKHLENQGTKVISLNSGLGDHLVFLNLIPELQKKYKHLILGCCYGNVFDGVSDITLVPVGATDAITGDNIYKWMIDHNWKDSVLNAYRTMLGLV